MMIDGPFSDSRSECSVTPVLEQLANKELQKPLFAGYSMVFPETLC